MSNVISNTVESKVEEFSPIGELVELFSQDKSLMITAFALSFLQIGDGLLTAIGVTFLGVHMEGNILIRSLMEVWGPIPALVLLKTAALAIIFTLCLVSSRVRWVRAAMQVMSCIYLFIAVLPWTYILYHKVL